MKITSNLNVGYIVGVGDQVPEAIQQLGAKVSFIEPDDMAWGDLSKHDVIVTGVRAYERRADLRAYNRRLLDYVQQGGNLIVLYNTQEFVPNSYAPFPAQLTARAEEVSEEDSPVEILAPADRVFTTPNRFTGW